jgi:hypothetical protein
MFGNGGAKDVIHEGLKCGRQVAEAKVHHCWFEQSSPHFEHGFVFIPFLNMYVIVPLTDVKLGKFDSSAKVVNEIADEWKGVLITNRP